MPTRLGTYFATILISAFIYEAVGTQIGAKVRGFDDFFVAYLRGSLFFLEGSIVASCLSTSTFTGQAGFIYDINSAFVLALGLLACVTNTDLRGKLKSNEISSNTGRTKKLGISRCDKAT